MNSTLSSEPSGTGQRRKSTLFCPDCGHESPPDGDWTRRRRRDTEQFVCPECRAAVTERPKSGSGVISVTADQLTAAWRTYARQVTAWMRL